MTNAFTVRFKGYRAEQNTDGTWNIFDVPIYAANVRSFGLIPVLDKASGEVRPEELVLRHDEKWLQSAIETARLDFEERGYEAPLHIHHHGRDEKVEEAGTIMPRYVKKTLYEGALLDTLFADLRQVPDATYQLIKAKRLRYRSAECPPSMDMRPEIKSLALLPHQPPHFKLQPLMIDETTVAGNAQAGVVCYGTGKSVYVLYDSTKGETGGGKIVDDKDDPKWATNGESRPGQMGAMSDVTQDPNDNTAVASDATRANSTDNTSVRESAGDPNANTKVKGGLMDKLMLMVSALCAKLGIGVDDPQATMPRGPAEQPRGDETRDPLAMAYEAELKKKKAAAVIPSAGLPIVSFDPAELVQMRAKMALYDQRFEAIDREGKVKGLVSTAVAELKGYNLSDKMLADLSEAAVLGEKPLAMYVSTIKSLGIKDPPKDPMGMLLAKAGKEAYPTEVMAYQAQGEEALARAADEWATYKALGDRVAHVKLAEFLKINVAAKSGGNFFGS